VVTSPEENFTYNLFAHPHFNNGQDLLITFNVNHRGFWPIWDDTRNYRARFYWMDVDRALSSSTPDTLDIWEYFETTHVEDPRPDPRAPRIRQSGGMLHLENIAVPSRLEIYTSDGRRCLYRRVSSEEPVSMEGLPKQVLLVRLSNRYGSSLRKIVNTY
jgi:hypothetical protein